MLNDPLITKVQFAHSVNNDLTVYQAPLLTEYGNRTKVKSNSICNKHTSGLICQIQITSGDASGCIAFWFVKSLTTPRERALDRVRYNYRANGLKCYFDQADFNLQELGEKSVIQQTNQ